MKAKLIEVGRNNVSKEVEVKNFYELENEIRNAGGIVSRSMELVESSGGKYDVIVGMGSKVGEVEITEQ